MPLAPQMRNHNDRSFASSTTLLLLVMGESEFGSAPAAIAGPRALPARRSRDQKTALSITSPTLYGQPERSGGPNRPSL